MASGTGEGSGSGATRAASLGFWGSRVVPAAAPTSSAAGWAPLGAATAPQGPLQAGDRQKSHPEKEPSPMGKTSGLLRGQTGVTRAREAAAAVVRT